MGRKLRGGEQQQQQQEEEEEEETVYHEQEMAEPASWARQGVAGSDVRPAGTTSLAGPLCSAPRLDHWRWVWSVDTPARARQRHRPCMGSCRLTCVEHRWVQHCWPAPASPPPPPR